MPQRRASGRRVIDWIAVLLRPSPIGAIVGAGLLAASVVTVRLAPTAEHVPAPAPGLRSVLEQLDRSEARADRFEAALEEANRRLASEGKQPVPTTTGPTTTTTEHGIPLPSVPLSVDTPLPTIPRVPRVPVSPPPVTAPSTVTTPTVPTGTTTPPPPTTSPPTTTPPTTTPGGDGDDGQVSCGHGYHQVIVLRAPPLPPLRICVRNGLGGG